MEPPPLVALVYGSLYLYSHGEVTPQHGVCMPSAINSQIIYMYTCALHFISLTLASAALV